MAAFDFPASPTIGQLYPTPPVTGQPVYIWDGEKWTTGATGFSSVYVADSAPTNAMDNSFWFESDVGLLYFRYNDGNSSQWVIASPTPDTSTFVRNDTAQSFTATQQAQARSNIAAAPFDAMAYSGMQVNGGFEVAQEWGSSNLGVNNTSRYVADVWIVSSNGQTVTAFQGGTGNPPGYPNSLGVYGPSTGNPSPAATHYCSIFQRIEGYRIARLAWGTANAQPLSIGFWVSAVTPGTYSGTVQNAAVNRCYAFTFAINASSVWEYKTVTIPGDTSGTWPTINAASLIVNFSIMTGSSYQTAAGAWTAGNFYGATGTANGVATNNNDLFKIAGVIVLPGIELPTSARAPFVMRPYDQELIVCKRYYQKILNPSGYAIGNGASTLFYHTFGLAVTMRAIPTTVSLTGNLNFTAGDAGYLATGVSSNFSTADTYKANLTSSTAVPMNKVSACIENTNGVVMDARI